MAVKIRGKNREEILDLLRQNRHRSLTGGSGAEYWNSVVDTVERFLTLVKERKEMTESPMFVVGNKKEDGRL